MLFLADGGSSRSGFVIGQAGVWLVSVAVHMAAQHPCPATCQPLLQEFVVDGGVTKKMVYPEEEEPAAAADTAGTAAATAAAADAAPAAAVAAGEQQAAAGEQGLAELSLEEEDRPPIMWPDSS